MANSPTLVLGSDSYYFTPDVNSSSVLLNTGDTPSISQGLLSAIPTAGLLGRIYYATDANTFFRDNSGSWDIVQPALTGDVSLSAGSTSTTLATVNTNVGSFGSSTSIPIITVDAKGRITAASSTTVNASSGQEVVLYCGTQSAPTRTMTSTTAAAAVRYIWQGSAIKPLPTAIEVLGWISNTARTIIVNVTDLNSGLVIATGSSAVNSTTNVFNLTINTANISTTQAVWEVSYRISATTATASISTVSIIF